MKVAILKSTLSRKNLMALTGLFLCFFLVIHLLGNLQLLLPAERAEGSFNYYSDLLSGNIFIMMISYVLYFSLIAHAVDALVITLKNKKVAAKYVYDDRKQVSKWYSRNMGILGTILLIFLVLHFKDFWYLYKFGAVPVDKEGYKNLYVVVLYAFKSWWYVLLYVCAMLALGYHLLHGFKSAVRTLGLYHPRYASYVQIFGVIYSYAITIGFSVIPVYVHLTQYGLWN
ncbi:succinate dehydrogenase cytochrome b subunit [Pedobacter hartonius]|uniref:Succinate dehydrogenase / fumarate reductase cytochrome b subunit n=1 Tax=Pedobacter hartonius TaxID=425514 RepID=A0A1H4E2R6_9SPHI|nr:succinate dehydrogenase cytochrome b subunit [Pedobacter hartonius]SEA79344.1 succinate dehydrogenase / fumarate reductase cytochrome b subunit [Pedobacter hartonius]